MTEHRVKASRLDDDEATVCGRGVVHFAVSLDDCARIPERVEIVWTEPVVHQCEGLKEDSARILYFGGQWHMQKKFLEWHFVTVVKRCPCCEWTVTDAS